MRCVFIIHKLSNIDLFIPEIGILRLTCFGYRIRYNDKATTWWHQKISFVSQLQDTFVILHLSKLRETLYFFTVLSASSPTLIAVALDTELEREEVADPPLLLSWDAGEAKIFAKPGLLEFDSIELLIWLGMVWVDEEENPELISPLKWNPENGIKKIKLKLIFTALHWT